MEVIKDRETQENYIWLREARDQYIYVYVYIKNVSY